MVAFFIAFAASCVNELMHKLNTKYRRGEKELAVVPNGSVLFNAIFKSEKDGSGVKANAFSRKFHY